MDWYLTGDDPGAVSVLRREIRNYLLRHARAGSSIADAELIVAELLSNAVIHAGGPVWVQITWTEEQPTFVVRDAGGARLPSGAVPPAVVPPAAVTEVPPRAAPALPPPSVEGGRGLHLVSRLAEEHTLQVREGGGVLAQARLPVQRAASRSIDPTPRTLDALPALDEAGTGGAFSREVFLRALVVQLAQAVEYADGPDAIEALIAQVGATVGGQMEGEYRQARELTQHRLTPEQLADCFVRLKQALDGGFSVVEVTDDRIVLANTRCPFGEVVRRSPALCRMTSSVFGGIAGRNSDAGAAVLLEERIAVGDPGCRVVVYLGEPPTPVARFAHRYAEGRPHPART